ncbi:MAG: hypothetical protein HYW93_04840 [Thaumarchaeota archaeon]|nr:hypothetical protein [Nitrososphaerota archaeon]
MGLGRFIGGSARKRGEPVAQESTPVPPDAHVVPTSLKPESDIVPFHVYHPNPYDAITILRHKKKAHEWLVAGWYIDTYREGGTVKGLMYRKVQTDQDKEVVINELKRQDKEAIAKFSLNQN